MKKGQAWLFCGVLAALGCAAGAPARPVALSPRAAPVQVVSAGASAEDLELVSAATAPALRLCQRFSQVRYQVTVRVHADHAGLEAAARQRRVPWMRGWARFSDVELEAPSAWGGQSRPEAVVELLAHELTHVVMYQAVAAPEAWEAVQIPLWFREGMASVASGQGYRRLDSRALGNWLLSHPALDPWADADRLTLTVQPVVYGAAHRAFEHLVAVSGDGVVRALMRRMRAGDDFATAFARSVGQGPDIYLLMVRADWEAQAAGMLLGLER